MPLYFFFFFCDLFLFGLSRRSFVLFLSVVLLNVVLLFLFLVSIVRPVLFFLFICFWSVAMVCSLAQFILSFVLVIFLGVFFFLCDGKKQSIAFVAISSLRIFWFLYTPCPDFFGHVNCSSTVYISSSQIKCRYHVNWTNISDTRLLIRSIWKHHSMTNF